MVEKSEFIKGLSIVGAGVILMLLIFAGIIFINMLNGNTVFESICINQSREKLTTCNTDCGEGFLSNLCKTECTSEHNNRLEQCTQN